MKIVFLNGPARSGKDTLGLMCAAALEEKETAFKLAEERGVLLLPYISKFAKVVKEGCHAALGIWASEDGPAPHDHYEDVKDQPLPEFRDRTPRQCYIQYSEGFMKPLFGPEIFGKLLWEGLAKDWTGPVHSLVIDWSVYDRAKAFQAGREIVHLITDSGFAEEVAPLVRKVGAENCLLVRVRAEGRGYTFTGDSRSYWDNTLDLPEIEVLNHTQGDMSGLDNGLAMILNWISASAPTSVTIWDQVEQIS